MHISYFTFHSLNIIWDFLKVFLFATSGRLMKCSLNFTHCCTKLMEKSKHWAHQDHQDPSSVSHSSKSGWKCAHYKSTFQHKNWCMWVEYKNLAISHHLTHLFPSKPISFTFQSMKTYFSQIYSLSQFTNFVFIFTLRKYVSIEFDRIWWLLTAFIRSCSPGNIFQINCTLYNSIPTFRKI